MAHEERSRAPRELLAAEPHAQTDIQELNRRTEREAGRRTEELAALLEISRLLASTCDLDAALACVLYRVADTIPPADVCAIFLHDSGQDCLIIRSERGRDSSKLCRTRIAPGYGPVGRSFVSGRTVVYSTDKATRARRVVANRKQAISAVAGGKGPGARSAIAVPLICRSRPIGVLLLENRLDASAFDDSHVRFVQAISGQLAVAIENDRLHQDSLAKEERRGRLVRELISAQEDERKRIARELHDETSQSLTALIVSLESAQESLPAELSDVRRRLESTRGLAVQLLDEIRRIIMELRPTLLDDLGLVPALRWYSKTQADRLGLKLSFRASELGGRIPPHVETAVFRLVQEAITNIGRHAQAKSMRVRLEVSGSALRATIEDDGQGFSVDSFLASPSASAGFGLQGMRERVGLLGGTLSIDSAPGRGTKVSVAVPLVTQGGEAR